MRRTTARRPANTHQGYTKTVTSFLGPTGDISPGGASSPSSSLLQSAVRISDPPLAAHALTCRGRFTPATLHNIFPPAQLLPSFSRRVGLGSSAPAAHPAARHQAEHLVSARRGCGQEVLAQRAATAHLAARRLVAKRPAAFRRTAARRPVGAVPSAQQFAAERPAAEDPVVRRPGSTPCGCASRGPTACRLRLGGSCPSAPRLRILRPGGLRPNALRPSFPRPGILRLSALWCVSHG